MNKSLKINQKNRFRKALDIFRIKGGFLSTSQAINYGIHPDTLYALRDSGALTQISRGVYCLKEKQILVDPDLVTVSMRMKNGVICLISALALHDLITQIPHEIHIALLRGAEEPKLDYPPGKTYRFSGSSFSEGVEIHPLDNISLRVYGHEKTIADCFKFRNKLGLDSAIEALRLYRERRNIKVDDLMYYSGVCRVSNIIRPYLEAIL